MTGTTRQQPTFVTPVSPPPRQGSSAGLWFLLVAILVLLGAIGVYAYETYIDDDPANPAATATATQEAPVSQPTVDNDEGDGQQVIEPNDGGYEDIVDEPTETSVPEPTEPPLPTETVPIIEPDDGNDMPTIASGNGESPEPDGGNDSIDYIEPGD